MSRKRSLEGHSLLTVARTSGSWPTSSKRKDLMTVLSHHLNRTQGSPLSVVDTPYKGTMCACLIRASK